MRTTTTTIQDDDDDSFEFIIEPKDSLDEFIDSTSFSDSDTEAALPPSAFRARGRHMNDCRTVATDELFDNSILGIDSPPRRPWRRDVSAAESVVSLGSLVSNNHVVIIEEEPPLAEEASAEETSPTSSPNENQAPQQGTTSTNTNRQTKKKNNKQRKPRYPLNGDTPSEKVLAGFICCADATLNFLEDKCGIQEEMQTIGEDIAWFFDLRR